MTPNEIDKLEAGLKLDMLIAEKVMGWKRGRRWGNGNGEWIIDGKGYDIHYRSWENTPPYSTHIAAAFQVVDKLCALEFDCNISLSSKLPSDDTERWYCHFQSGDDNAPWRDDFKMAQDWAPTAPLAVCRAALKAIGEPSP